MKRVLSLIVVASAMLLSNAAMAGVIGDFEVEALGTVEIVGDNLEITAEVIDQTPDLGFESFDASWLIDWDDSPFSFMGDFTLSGADGDLFATATGAAFFEGDFWAQAGTFVINGGTGAFDGVTGSGVISGFTTDTDGGITGEQQIKLAGTIVPAPAALALFGAAGLLGRRRRRA